MKTITLRTFTVPLIKDDFIDKYGFPKAFHNPVFTGICRYCKEKKYGYSDEGYTMSGREFTMFAAETPNRDIFIVVNIVIDGTIYSDSISEEYIQKALLKDLPVHIVLLEKLHKLIQCKS